MSLLKPLDIEEKKDHYVNLGQDGVLVPVLTMRGRIIYKNIMGAINIKDLDGVDNTREALSKPALIIAQRCFKPSYIKDFGRVFSGKPYVKVLCYMNVPLHIDKSGYLAVDERKVKDIKDFKTYVWVDISKMHTKQSENYKELDTISMKVNSDRFASNRRKINKIFH